MIPIELPCPVDFYSLETSLKYKRQVVKGSAFSGPDALSTLKTCMYILARNLIRYLRLFSVKDSIPVVRSKSKTRIANFRPYVALAQQKTLQDTRIDNVLLLHRDPRSYSIFLCYSGEAIA
jgi:hypothetical protein